MRQKFELEVRLIRHSNVRVCVWMDPKSKSDRCSSARVTRVARSTGRYGRRPGLTGSQRDRMNSHVCKGNAFAAIFFSAGNRKTAAEPPSGSCKFLSTFLSFVSVRMKQFVSFHFFFSPWRECKSRGLVPANLDG